MGKAIFKIISKILNLSSFNKIILKIYNEVLDVIYPPEEKCIICREEGFIGLCPHCKSSINRATVEKDNLSYGFYGGVIKTLILKFKYESNFTAGYLLSNFLIEMIEEEKITKEIAECIYVGMIHDTGVFQYSCTSAKTMNIAGKLMEKGIDFTRIVDETFYTKTFNQNRIMGQALVDAKLSLEGQVISSVVTKKQMEEFQVLPKHLDGIVSQLRVTKDVEVAVFLYETEDGYKVSMRSNGDVDVAKIAVQFGGGGHMKAAGVSMEGTPEEILAALMKEIEKQL